MQHVRGSGEGIMHGQQTFQLSSSIFSSIASILQSPAVQVSTSAALQGYKLQVERMTRIANALPAFTSLCKQDQVMLSSHWLTILISDWSRWRC